MIKQHVTRRRTLALGTISAVGLAGLAIAPGRSQAAVTLDISDETFSPDDGQLETVFITASGEFQFSQLDTPAAEWAVYLLVDDGSGDNWQAVGIDDGATDGTSGSGTYALRGAVTAASGWDATDFQANGDGSPQSVDVPVAVMLVLRDGGGDIIADAEANATATVTVEHGGAVVSVTGTADLHALDEPGDPTPTLPGGA